MVATAEDFRAQLRAHALYDDLLVAARGGTIADGLATLRKSDRRFLRQVQARRDVFVAELYAFLPE